MYIKVRVKPGARAEEVIKESDDHFVVSVREKAERNQANSRVLEILRAMFPGKSVRIIHGHQGPSKLVAVD
ncbi:DUF167 domain-containing protein [Patescibacteria group bacterium]|nr:DUF167 domain-containing protein [Patescibacteria group bacterium]MDE1941255.1 DUF167 domain-containing protein [Patescibacteria group bacterium]